MEQNREVFAVPGNITSRNSFGTNYLIKGAGAKLVQQWQDIAAELPPQIAAQLLPPPLGEKKKEKSTGESAVAWCRRTCRSMKQSVFKLLSADNPAHIDALVDESKLSISDLTARC